MYVGLYSHDLSSFRRMANSGYRILSGPGTLLLYQAGKRLAFSPFALMIENLGYHLLSLTTING
jgi:hypothetical protein